MALGGQDWLMLLLAAFLVLLNGFFVAAEFAIVKVRSTQVEQLARQGDPRAKLAKHIVSHLDSYLSTCQVGITVASLGLGWIGEPAVADLIDGPLARLGLGSAALVHGVAFFIAFGVITFAHVVIGEMAPKGLAIRHPLESTRRLVAPLALFHYLLLPFTTVLNGASLLLLRAFGIRQLPTETLPTGDELEHIVENVDEKQVGSRLAREVLANVFWLRRLTVRQVMIHRTRVVALDVRDDLGESMEKARASGFTRFPVVDGALDNVVGVVHLKDLAFLDPTQGSDVLTPLAHPITVVPETATLDTALVTLRDSKAKMGVVADEYGGIEGIITIEDILEELVGQLQDTFEEEAQDYVVQPGGAVRIRGDAALHDLEDVLGIRIDDQGVSTVGGFLVQQFGQVPKIGDSIQESGWKFTVLDASKRLVRQVHAERVAAPEPSTE